jgi:hypothetical protein
MFSSESESEDGAPEQISFEEARHVLEAATPKVTIKVPKPRRAKGLEPKKGATDIKPNLVKEALRKPTVLSPTFLSTAELAALKKVKDSLKPTASVPRRSCASALKVAKLVKSMGHRRK